MKRPVLTCLLCLLLIASARAAAPLIRDGDKLAIVGDSITEQKLYSVYIEDYLTMCQPQLKADVMQFGWGGETSWGFLARMDNDCLRFKPTIASTCYGMNDGGYGELSPQRAEMYRKSMAGILEKFKGAGVHTVIVGSPGVVDSYTYDHPHPKPTSAQVYNHTLDQLRDIARELAQQNHQPFADVYGAMMEAMKKAKEKYGQDYAFAGGDGVHPGPAGHLVMAYAFLKAMGFDGDLGTITLDLSSKKATATEGHAVKSFDGSAVTIESSRYPFCFYDQPDTKSTTRSIVELTPFNQDLNRLTLVIKNAPASRVRITWGEQSKEFSADELARGINLAGEFIDGNPFVEPFKRVEAAIKADQNFETPMIKQLVHSMPSYAEMLPDEKPALSQLVSAAQKKESQLATASKSAMKPVTHTIRIQPVR